jgi:predicted regulator of Ras-like GTPase activity (Roadblock/LC7/MglB family)
MAATDDQALSGLRRIAGVTAAYLVERGVPPPDAGESVGEAQAALLAATVTALAQAADDLGLGSLAETIVEAERGAVVAGVLPGGRAAIVVTGAGANLGMIRMELRRLRRSS